jgi:hypothetical protein
MRIRASRILTVGIFPLFLLFNSSDVFAWSATYLGGGNWAVNCANGSSYSYAGSSAGLDTVGPGLCPGGLVKENPVGGGVKAFPEGVIRGVPQSVNRELLQNKKEIGDKSPQKMRGYPPNGYPCLGCVPCGSSYCDIETKNVLFTPKREN